MQLRQIRHHPTRLTTQPNPLATSHRRATGRCCSPTATTAARPCVIITAPDSTEDSSLNFPGSGAGGQHEALTAIAAGVRRLCGVEAVVLTPSCSSTGSGAGLTCGTPLQLLHRPDLGHPLTFSLQNASPEDCVLVAAEHSAGLLRSLGLAPVLVLVGIGRGPALSSDMEQHPAVAAARSASLLGLPAVAACLATTSPSASPTPAVDATLALLRELLALLQHQGGRSSSSSWPAAANHPRAHYPFPSTGRWALGAQLPLPDNPAARGHSEGGLDCWALGEDNAWLGRGSPGRQPGSNDTPEAAAAAAAAAGQTRPTSKQAEYSVLQTAWAEGDALLCLNVPPTWRGQFAATRPGVLWHCWSVSATHGSGWDSSSSSSSSAGANTGSRRSWAVDSADLFGRTLPASSYASASVPVGSNFVAQDNTRQRFSTAADGGAGRRPDGDVVQVDAARLPTSFTINRGTLLNDAATCGDVEAVFSGKAAVTLVQTWPAGHPLSLRDEALLAALDESGPDGLPAWITQQQRM